MPARSRAAGRGPYSSLLLSNGSSEEGVFYALLDNNAMPYCYVEASTQSVFASWQVVQAQEAA